MKILITEAQFGGLLILLEEKNQKIIDKLVKFGLSQETSIELTKIAGKLSIFLAFKLLDKFSKSERRPANWDIMSIKEKFDEVGLRFFNFRDEIQSVVDWFRVGLNGNIEPYKNLTFDELYVKSAEWHDSLGVGDDKIDYVEEHEIIIDFRKNGIGFYWVDLATNRCTEEGERMGHCASSSGRLYSLREYKPLGIGNNTLNKSHLTMSLSKEGKILQLKGPKNSKPPESLHQYILPLLYYRGENGHYLVNGFGYEYDSEHDFKLLDLDKNQIIRLNSLRPNLFDGRGGKMVLISKGIMEKPKDFNTFILSVAPEDIEDYVVGSWDVISKPKRLDVFEALLSGEFHLVYDDYYYEWKSSLQYETSKENDGYILKILKKFCEDNNNEFDEDLSLEDMIEEYDEDDLIKDAIAFSANDANNDAAYVYFIRKLRECLEEYGTLLKLDYTGADIKIDLDNFDVDNLNDYFFKTEDIEEVFEELLNDEIIKKPDFEISEYWTPNTSTKYFNEILKERLDEIS